MELRYKIILVFVALLSLSGCIDEDLESCQQGIDVFLYSKSMCQQNVSYPDQIKNITLCVFDKNGMLVSYRQKDDVTLNEDYTERIDVESGLYTVIVWSGINDSSLDVTKLQDGETRKGDLLFRLKREQGLASSIDGKSLYYGESRAVYVENGKSDALYEQVSVNMLEVTNRLTVTVEGLNGNLDDYEINIESDNGSMNVDGSIAEDEVIKYDFIQSVSDGILESQFTLLKLETGNNNTLVIRDKVTGEELYRESLLGTLLLKNPYVNLNCDHDFTINFTAKDQCNCGTYMITEIWVNSWLVHSYNTDI